MYSNNSSRRSIFAHELTKEGAVSHSPMRFNSLVGSVSKCSIIAALSLVDSDDVKLMPRARSMVVFKDSVLAIHNFPCFHFAILLLIYIFVMAYLTG